MQGGYQSANIDLTGPNRKIGVVTVTHNSATVLADFLQSVWQQSHRDFALYIIDSGSSDRTAELLEDIRDPRVRNVIGRGNVGFAAGCNIGIKMALTEGCEAVLLINNDTSFGPELFAGLLAGLGRHNCQMTTPKMYYCEPSDVIWAAGGYIDKWRGFAARHLGTGQKDGPKFDVAKAVTFTPFCCVLIAEAVFERIGLLDESYFVYVEDLDYCYRAMRSGIKMWYLPECRLWHKVSSLTGGEDSPFAIRYMTRNRILFFRKNLAAGAAYFWTFVYKLHMRLRRLRNIDSEDCWRAKGRAIAEGFTMSRSGGA